MFTIEVQKRGKDESFGFGELRKDTRVVHNGCYGGTAKWTVYEAARRWGFRCSRCEDFTDVNSEYQSPTLLEELIKTAIDGEERKLNKEVRVVQV